ncbi:hypothetical protein BDZ91DRAFT_739459 [Kalaharituber pfeilii]|nr:hypothetical protein BDZ91DRAFT_739459 [Kalaharituber pfeilii]
MAEAKYSVELFPETIALAIWIIIYTFISALCALFTHILFRLNKQKAAYVSLTCCAIFLQQLVTIAQETIALIRWPDLQKQVWQDNNKMWRNASASIVYKSSPDLSLKITFAIRVYFFNVESLLFFFWSFLLFTSVWEIHWSWIRNQRFVTVTRYFSFILPAIVSILVNLPAIMAHEILHLALLDFIMVITITCGVIFLLLNLLKFILVAMSRNRSRKHQRIHMQDDRGTLKSCKEDKWIMLRFIIGFLVIGALQTSFLYSQYEYAMAVMELRKPDAPAPVLGWTKTQQLSDWAYYLAGSSTGILMILIFGTTQESRMQARKLFARYCVCSGSGRKRKSAQTTSEDPDVENIHPISNAPIMRFSDTDSNRTSVYPPSQYTNSSTVTLTLAPAPIARPLTAAFQHQRQSSRLSRPPQFDVLYPGIEETENVYPPSTYRSTGTSYEEEYYHRSQPDDGNQALETTWQSRRDRDVVISQYDYRQDGLCRTFSMRGECVSPLTPEVKAFSRFQKTEQPIHGDTQF